MIRNYRSLTDIAFPPDLDATGKNTNVHGNSKPGPAILISEVPPERVTNLRPIALEEFKNFI